MASVDCICSCKAAIQIEGTSLQRCGYRLREFLEAHSACREEDKIKEYFRKQEEINDQFLQALKDAISAADEMGVIYNPVCACGRPIRKMFVVERDEET
jgi:hypothetical protein